LFVIENGQNMMYRFQAEPEQQQEILENFMEYMELIKEYEMKNKALVSKN